MGRTLEKNKPRQQPLSRSLAGFDVTTKSGREDLNLRPHGPEPCALAKLSYAPSLREMNLSDPRRSVNRIIVEKLADEATARAGRLLEASRGHGVPAELLRLEGTRATRVRGT